MKSNPIVSAFRWLAGHELSVLVGLAVVVGGTWSFIELADEVSEGELQAFDEQLLRAMRDQDNLAKPIGPVWVNELGRDITALGGYFFLGFVTISVATYLAFQKKYSAMCFVLGAVASGYVVMRILKVGFGRARPDVVPHLAAALHPSFPSGHSMMSAIVFLTLGALLSRLESSWKLKIYFLLLATFLTFVVGISRVYMGVHYPTDVLAGWTCGFVWAAICSLTARYLQSRGKFDMGF